MQNKDILSTLQKHIGVIEDMPEHTKPYSSIHIHKFSEDMKGANEFIGALQSASVVLKKILKLAQSIDPQSEPIQIAQTKSTIQELITHASFMDLPLFDSNLNATINGTTYSLVIDNPMPLCEDCVDSINAINNLINYTEEKVIELNEMLSRFSEALTAPIAPGNSQNRSSSQYDLGDFNEFNPEHFARIYKD